MFLILTALLALTQPTANQTRCKAMLQSLQAGEVEALGNGVDLDAFFAKVTDLLDKDLRQGQETSLEQFIDGVAPRMAPTFVNNLSNQQELRVAFLGMAADGRSGLFRFYSPQYLNYLRIYFDEQGRIEDLFWYSDGETIAEALAFAANLMLVTTRMDSGAEETVLEPWYDVALLKPLLMKGKGSDVLQRYKAMRDAYKRIKNVQITHFHASFQQNDETLFENALTELDRFYPKDSSLSLLQLDALMLRGKHQRAMQVIENLARDVAMDPYLDLYRAAIYLEMGETKLGRQYLVHASNYPDARREAMVALKALENLDR